MGHHPGNDPIRENYPGVDRFNLLWLKHGEKMTWIQRIGFATISLLFFSIGLLVETLAINSLFDGDFLSVGTLGSLCAIVAALFILVLGALGLKSVLRFK